MRYLRPTSSILLDPSNPEALTAKNLVGIEAVMKAAKIAEIGASQAGFGVFLWELAKYFADQDDEYDRPVIFVPAGLFGSDWVLVADNDMLEVMIAVLQMPKAEPRWLQAYENTLKLFPFEHDRLPVWKYYIDTLKMAERYGANYQIQVFL